MNESSSNNVATAVMTAFLRTGKSIDHASSVLLMIGIVLFQWRFGVLEKTTPLVLLIGVAALVVAMVEKYFAWRVALDAELFAVLQNISDNASAFDQALAQCLGRSPGKSRSMQNRWLGARGLLFYQVLTVLAQAAFVLVVMIS